MATIKDIAKKCNVSVSTVSYALQDKKSTISEATKERIRQVAKEMNYVPNAHAVRLKNQKTYQIGIFVPGFQGHIHPTILAGLARVLRTIDTPYNMIVTFCDDKMTPVTSRAVDLAIIMDSTIKDEVVKTIAKIVPIITFDKIVEDENIYNTYINQSKPIKDLVTFYADKGVKKIGFIQGSLNSIHNSIRYNAYKEALQENNIPFDEKIIYNPNAFTELKGYEVISNELKNVKELPFDALMGCNDELAIGAMKALNDLGYNAPNDYQISGFDNIKETDIQSPKLTTVNVDWYQYGIDIANLALKILDKTNTSHKFEVECEIIYKKTTLFKKN